jgi:hypothetical protein
LDNVEYYFYLNYNEIKYTASLTKNCIVLRVPHRILEGGNNVLVIKAVKRNEIFRIRAENVISYWLDARDKVLMVGVVGVNKKRSKSKKQTGMEVGVLPSITAMQSCQYLQYVNKKINQVPYQIATLYDCSGTQKIQLPVRSFGCQHVECFDYF